MPTPLEILIRTVADTRGATDAAAALKSVQDAAAQAALESVAGAERGAQAERQLAEAARATEQALRAKAGAAAQAAAQPAIVPPLPAREFDDIERGLLTSIDSVVDEGRNQTIDAFADGLTKVGKSTKEATSEFNKFGSAGTQVLQGLNQAASGGIGSVIGLTNAVRGLVTLAATGLGPTGAIAAGAAALAGLALILRNRLPADSGPATRSLEEVEKALDAARGAAEQLAKVNLAGIRGETRSLKADSDELAAATQLQIDLQRELLQAQAAAARTRIAEDLAANRITNVEATEQTQALDLNLALAGIREPAERAQRELETASASVRAAAKEQQKLAAALRIAERDQTEFSAALQDARQQLAETYQRRDELVLRDIQRGIDRGAAFGVREREFAPRIAALEAEISGRVEVKDAQGVTRQAATPGLQDSLAGAQERAKTLGAAAGETDQQLADAKRAETAARRKLAALLEQQGILEQTERERAAAALARARREAEERDRAAARDREEQRIQAEQTRVRLASEDAARRVRIGAERAIVDPQFSDVQRERAQTLLDAARTAEAAPTTDNLRTLNDAITDMASAFVGESPQIIESLRSLREQVLGAGRASLRSDLEDQARARAEQERTIERAKESRPQAALDRSTGTASDGEDAGALQGAADALSKAAGDLSAAKSAPVQVNVAVKVDQSGVAASSEVSTTPTTTAAIPRRARGGDVKEDEPVVVTDAPGSPPEVFVPSDPSQPAQRLSGSGPTVFTPPADGTIVPESQAPRMAAAAGPNIGLGDPAQANTTRDLPGTVPTFRGAPGVPFGATPIPPTRIVTNSPRVGFVSNGDPSQPSDDLSLPSGTTQYTRRDGEVVTRTEAQPESAPVPSTESAKESPPPVSQPGPRGFVLRPIVRNELPRTDSPENPVVRSNAEALQRAAEDSAAFRANPLNAPIQPAPPTPPSPPTPPKPAGFKGTRAQWREHFQANAARGGTEPTPAAEGGVDQDRGRRPQSGNRSDDVARLESAIASLKSELAGLGSGVSAAVRAGVAEAMRSEMRGQTAALGRIEQISSQHLQVAQETFYKATRVVRIA